MSDDKTKDQTSRGDAPRSPLTLRPRTGGNVSTGTVKQSFSHGRSKTVVVETKRRIGTPPQGGGHQPSGRPSQDYNVTRQPQGSAPRPAAGSPSGSGGSLRQEEQDARQRAIAAALADQQRREAEARAAAAREAAKPQVKAEPAPAETPKAEAPTPAPTPASAPTLAAETPKPAEAPSSDARPATEARSPSATPRPTSERAPSDRPRERDQGRTYTPGQRTAPQNREGGRDFRPRDGQPSRDGQREGFRPGGPRSDRPQGDRGPRPDGARPPRDGARPPREGGETVRYSANAPRMGRPASVPVNAPSTAEVARVRSTRGEAGTAKTADVRRNADEEELARGKRGGKAGAPTKAVSQTRGEPKRREGRLTLQAVVGDDEGAADRMRSLASVRRAREREREKRKGSTVDQARISREVIIPDIITVQELSNRMAVRSVDIIKLLMKQGMMLKINDVIDSDTAELVATEFGHTVRRVSESDVETGFIDAADHDDDTVVRPPVVAVMGHVDHGKTSLLDALRKTDTAGGEAGGITQHIGAYQVRLPAGERVTFLDTPGHAAFSAMRARGANVTDIVVLVVAADDGVMPQTVEAINHARAAKTPLIVAVNKIDKPDAKPQNIVNELLQHEIVAESLGGDTQIVEVSAKTGKGLDNLIEAILLQAEVLELKANPDRTAEGVVIEAKLDKGRGPVATVLVKRGTLKRGDIVVAGQSWGRVRALINERNEQLAEAGPSEPVEILGLDGAPDPGEAFAVVENDARAREITEYRQRVKREKTMAPVGAVSLTDMMSRLATKKAKEVQLIVKSDVQGSGEAIVSSLEKLGTDEVRARIIHSAAGAITESDVQLAKGSNAPIIGFNVRAGKQARDLAEREGVEIRYYSIIYDLLDDIKGVMSGLLAPTIRETFLGNAEVLEAFDITKVGKVAGCRVTEGRVVKGARVRIIRQDIVLQEMGVLQTLKRFKDEVNEVVVGQECGMAFKDFQDIKPGDLIECFTVEEIKRSL